MKQVSNILSSSYLITTAAAVLSTVMVSTFVFLVHIYLCWIDSANPPISREHGTKLPSLHFFTFEKT